MIKFGSLGKIPWRLELKAALAAIHRQLPPSPATPGCEIIVALFASISHRKAEVFFFLSQPTSTVPQSISTRFFFLKYIPWFLWLQTHYTGCLQWSLLNLWHSLVTSLGFEILTIQKASGSSRKHCEGRRSYCQEWIAPGDHSDSFLKWLKKTPSVGFFTRFILTINHSWHWQEGEAGKAEKRRWGTAVLDVGRNTLAE